MDTLIKQPGETVKYDMQMSGLGRLGINDNILSVNSVVSDIVGISITGTTHNGASLVQFVISGGVDGITYKITVTVTTVSGDILQGEGLLRIKDL